jgi:hypothetical protein
MQDEREWRVGKGGKRALPWRDKKITKTLSMDREQPRSDWNNGQDNIKNKLRRREIYLAGSK